MRTGLFAMLAVIGLIFVGCGETDTTPPPGTDTDTPTVDIDPGILAPGDDAGEDSEAE